MLEGCLGRVIELRLFRCAATVCRAHDTFQVAITGLLVTVHGEVSHRWKKLNRAFNHVWAPVVETDRDEGGFGQYGPRETDGRRRMISISRSLEHAVY